MNASNAGDQRVEILDPLRRRERTDRRGGRGSLQQKSEGENHLFVVSGGRMEVG